MLDKSMAKKKVLPTPTTASVNTFSWKGMMGRDETRGYVIQAVVLLAVLSFFSYLFFNADHNLKQMGLSLGFDFLNSTAGFDISWSIIPYDPTMTYWRVFWVGILNTLVLSGSVIVFGTIIGTIVGIMRLSANPMVSQLARWYVELVRNIPLLIQIIFWFTVVFSKLPSPRQSYHLGESFVLNNRGLYVPSPALQHGALGSIILLLGVLVGFLFLAKWSYKQRRVTGKHSIWLLLGSLITLAVVYFFFVESTSIFVWSIPTLHGFNFEGGLFLPAAFGAAFVAMTIYRSASIAETVRAGMQSIDRGQGEASSTIGFSRIQTLRLILIPQAARAIVPPMTNAWLATTKDSSLAVAIGFPELVSLFMQTSINQTGRAIEIIAMVMGFYVAISLLMSYLLNKYNDRVQLKVG